MPPVPSRALRVNTVELRRHPGTRREVLVDLAADELGVEDPRLTGSPVQVELVVESTLDGIVVSGAVRVTMVDGCRRCLRDVSTTVSFEVDELYQAEVSDPDAFELGPDLLDLEPLVRDGVLLVLGDPPPLCREDCAGICPVCGADRNEERCGCDDTVRDERWSALDQLDLGDVT